MMKIIPLKGAPKVDQDIERVIFSSDMIKERTAELGSILAKDYQNKNPLVVGVLKGAVPFLTDLVLKMPIKLELDFMDVSSYGAATKSSGEVKILKDLDTSVENRHVLIVEDIIDSGQTLNYLVELFKYRRAESIKIVTLLDKPEGRINEMKADYVGFEVENAFVVGYGLDYAEMYRNLPYVGVLKPKIYEAESL